MKDSINNSTVQLVIQTDLDAIFQQNIYIEDYSLLEINVKRESDQKQFSIKLRGETQK